MFHESSIYVPWLIICSMSHPYMCHDSFNVPWLILCVLCVPWLIHMCDMLRSDVYTPRIYMRWNSFICVPMTLLCVRHDSFTCVTFCVLMPTSLIHVCNVTPSYTWHDSFICVTCCVLMPTGLVYICDVTPSYVWHNSCIGVTWLIQTCDILRSSDADKAASYVQQDQWMRGTGLISMCTVTHLYVYRDSFIREAWIIYKCVYSLI